MLKKTPGGKPSTAEPVLIDLARDYELPAAILEYRGLAKLNAWGSNQLTLNYSAHDPLFTQVPLRASW